ncbi:hypothetical protein [Cohnella thermotolerans]|uniref:hypothetical protein n=1 Tax=Cohnella thermotolerans TaxID=329858 RepID=UPI0003FE6C86|nr:hypothetical protein [Cohnella thermotolerans]
MNRYFKLVHLEVYRFRYILFGLMAVTAIVQIAALLWVSRNEVAQIQAEGVAANVNRVLFPDEKLSFAWAIFSTQRWFALPILLSIATLGLYVFLIWYRDWLGRDTFIYRLLTLPTARRNIFLSKLTAILLFVFGLISFQLALLPIERILFNMAVAPDLREPSPFTDAILASQVFKRLLPLDRTQFLVSYGFGIIAVLAVFAAILLERSYRRTGILYGFVYLAACAVAVLYPLYALGLNQADAYLYPEEVIAIELAVCLVVAAASIWLSWRLLAKKITV